MESVRVGVAGVGHWATTAHLPALVSHPRAVVAAIADPNPTNLKRAAGRFDVRATFTNPVAMFEGCDLDAAIVATPHAYHYEIAKMAIDRGLNVLIEKPLVITPQHGRDLIASAEAAGVEIIVGYTWHYNAQVLEARSWLEAGRIGVVSYANSFLGSSPLNLFKGTPEAYPPDRFGSGDDYHAPLPNTYSDPVLAGGGQAQTQLTHSLALLLFMTRLTPARVVALMENLGTRVDVVDALVVRFTNDALATIGSTGAVTPLEHTDILEYLIHGDEGHIHFNVSDGSLRLFSREGFQEGIRLAGPDRYRAGAPAQNLVDVTLGETSNGSPVDVAQSTVEVIDAAYLSSRADGSAVDLDRL